MIDMKQLLPHNTSGKITMMALAAAALPATAKAQQPKPMNIVYITTDDHTAQMMSC